MPLRFVFKGVVKLGFISQGGSRAFGACWRFLTTRHDLGGLRSVWRGPFIIIEV